MALYFKSYNKFRNLCAYRSRMKKKGQHKLTYEEQKVRCEEFISNY